MCAATAQADESPGRCSLERYRLPAYPICKGDIMGKLEFIPAPGLSWPGSALLHTGDIREPICRRRTHVSSMIVAGPRTASATG